MFDKIDPHLVKAGDVIFRQGEPGRCAYIIESGRVEIVLARPDGKVYSLGFRGAGSIIGEMSIFDQGSRIASVRAVSDCTLVEITSAQFNYRLSNADPVLRTIFEVVLARYRETLIRAEILGDDELLDRLARPDGDLFSESYAVASLRMASDLGSALKNGQLSLAYQPIVDLPSNRTIGFEALARWLHPQQGFISPSLFIPVAEEGGLIEQVSEWVLGKACETMHFISSVFDVHNRPYLSINFSAEDFSSSMLTKRVSDTLHMNNVRPQDIQLEITERVLMKKPEVAKTCLSYFRDSGMRIAIDDFGTGYSSLNYLHNFPIDTLKIDRSFVGNIIESQRSLDLVRSIVGIGKNLNMAVIAEGVETWEQARALSELGCDHAQGYYFSEPITEYQLMSALSAYRLAVNA
jgi:EAL domain-containing protein (putative c-di-GMP-specific phosphodiesterase class I)